MIRRWFPYRSRRARRISGGCWPSEILRQIRVAHQVAVAFAGGAASFVEGPNHEALAAPAITGSEDTFDISGILFEFGPDIGTGVTLKREGLEEGLFRSKKTHRQQD